MPRLPFPDALAMRGLRAASASPEERERVAAALRQAGRDSQALLLYEGGADAQALAAACLAAIEQGNAFQLLALRRLGFEVKPAQLAAAAANAERTGRFLDARTLFLAGGDPEALRRFAAQLPQSLRPPPPPPPPTEPPALTSDTR